MRSKNNRKSAYLELPPRVDVSISGEDQSPEGLVDEQLTSIFTISASGLAPAEEVIFRSDYGSAVIQSVTADSGTCIVKKLGPVCTLATVPAGQSRQVTVTWSSPVAGSFHYEAWVTASNDDVPFNERFSIHPYIMARHALDLYGGVGYPTTAGEPVALTFYVQSTGLQPLEDTTVRLDFDIGLQVLSVTAADGSCNPVPDAAAWTCALPLLGAETSSPIEIVAQADNVGLYAIRATGSSPNNDNGFDPTIEMSIHALHAFDMQVSSPDVVLGYDHRDAFFFVTVSSNSLHDEKNVRLRIALPDAIIIQRATANAGCTISGSVATCTFGTIPYATGFAAAQLWVRSNVVGRFNGTATVFSWNDGDPTNNRAKISFDIKPNIDVSVKPPASRTVVANEAFTIPVRVRSATKPLTGATLEIRSRLANMTSVKTTHGSCQVLFETLARCSIDALPANSIETVYVRALPTQKGNGELRFEVSTPGDVDYSNNSATTSLTIQ
jgi:hypothetical protein